MALRLFECEICNENFDEAERRLLFLQCGHSFCRTCLLAVESRVNKSCPACRQPIALPVDQLPVNFALIPSQENNGVGNLHSAPSDRCQTHGFGLDNFCVTCGVLICMKCVIKSHLQHHIVVEEDLFDENEHASVFAIDLQKKVETSLGCLTKSLTAVDTIQNHIRYLHQSEEDIQQCEDTLLIMRISVLEDMEAWKSDGAKSAAQKRALFRMLPRQWQNAAPSVSKELVFEIIKNQVTKLQETLRTFQDLLPEFQNESSSLDSSFGPAKASELFKDNVPWLVSTNDDVRRALASVHDDRRPSCLRVVSSNTEPIRMLPEVLDVLGTACTGEIWVKNMNSFWGSSITDLQAFIAKHGDNLETFFGSFDEATAVVRARGTKGGVMLGIGIGKTDDIQQFPLIDSWYTSVSFNGCLPLEEEMTTKVQSWEPRDLHFPDLRSGDQISVIRLLAGCKDCMYIYLPRCRLLEDEMWELLKSCKNALTIRCQHLSLTDNARARLDTLAKQQKLFIHWNIDPTDLYVNSNS